LARYSVVIEWLYKFEWLLPKWLSLPIIEKAHFVNWNVGVTVEQW
jgi:hypothetical protein